MDWLITGTYVFSLLMIFIFGLVQLSLTLRYRTKKRAEPRIRELTSFPRVTIQLPLYNEKYVAGRLIDVICKMEYPQDRLEIQVLDDSDDETTAILSEKIDQWQARGIDIRLIRRENRTGYKAGALQHGLELAGGEYIAIFDADFLPDPRFLKQTLPHFTPETGMVQTRWGHLNEDYNMLTRMQAFGLNAHFTVEQGGRQASGRLINFNGTGGIWKKRCIEEAGGWQYDTLTEDLDLSYRAQLNGWKLVYLEEVVSPAELPVVIPAIKSQQYRWNKGAAETARKTLGRILSSRLSPATKLHAVAHLLNSSVFIFLLLAAVTSVPVLFLEGQSPNLARIAGSSGLFMPGFLALAAFYWTSAKTLKPGLSAAAFARELPLFIALSMGLSLYNSIAVTEGYLGIKTPFVRTPKFNILRKQDPWKGNAYLQQALTPVTFLEGLLFLYFLFAMAAGLIMQHYGLLFFHTLLSLGFGAVFFLSLKPVSNA